MSARTLEVVLLALTGPGNTVLDALLNDPRVKVGAVFTHRYDGPFPYYPERQLLDLCDDRGVECYHGHRVGSDEGLARLRALAPDVILIASFKEILNPSVLELPRLGVVNLHPSLLPRHRGPCPTNAALLEDDEFAGVTAHIATDGQDEGGVLLQRRVSIGDLENDGQLRHRLARLAGEMVPELVSMCLDGGRLSGTPQDSRLATYAPRPRPEDGFLERASSVDEVRRKVRALNPLPGTSVQFGGERIPVNRVAMLRDSSAAAPGATDDTIDLVIGSQAIRLLRTSSVDQAAARGSQQ